MTRELNIFSAGADKLLTFADRIAQWQAKESFVPVTLEIQPTERCNHHCPGCQSFYSLSSDDVHSKARTGFDLDIDLLAPIWRNPPAGVVISGNTGDPLLHPRIEELLNILKERAIPTVLLTNGEALTESIARAALNACTGIRISLDAQDEDHFRRVHGSRFGWPKVLKAIRLLVSTKNVVGSDCLVGIGYLTNKQSRSGMVPATRLAGQLGVDYIQFRPFHYDTAELNVEFEQCNEMANNTKLRVFMSDQKYDRMRDFHRSYSHCQGSLFSTVLDARGDFYICCHHVGRASARVGSIVQENWLSFLDSHLRRDALGSFPMNHCPPLCRLHTQNEVLDQIATEYPPSQNVLTEEIRRHACFL